MSMKIATSLVAAFLSLQACNGQSQEQDDVAAPETPSAVTETPSAVTETPSAVTETPSAVTETPSAVTETPDAPVDGPADVTEATTKTDEPRQADSHVHGDAALAIVLEGNTLTFELDTPLYNLVGFEHAPETEEQKATVDSVETVLSQPTELFQPNDAAGCEPNASMGDVHLFEESHIEHEEHDDHEEHEDHDTHESHADHKDAVVSYEFTCAAPGSLEMVSTRLLTEFSNMTELEVVYLGPSSQNSYKLTSSETEISLK